MSQNPDDAKAGGVDSAKASCQFTLPFSGSAQDFVNKARQKVQGAGGTFNGNTSNGSFSVPIPIVGSVEGNYQINGQQVSINITKKPFVISCSAIESYVRSQIG